MVNVCSVAADDVSSLDHTPETQESFQLCTSLKPSILLSHQVMEVVLKGINDVQIHNLLSNQVSAAFYLYHLDTLPFQLSHQTYRYRHAVCASKGTISFPDSSVVANLQITATYLGSSNLLKLQ